MKYTKTKWLLRKQFNGKTYDPVILIPNESDADEDGNTTHASSIIVHSENAQADARLMSNANEMYEVLKELCLVPNKHRPQELWDRANAIIKQCEEEND